MPTNDMGRSLSRSGGRIVNNDGEIVSLNTSEADTLPCAYCLKEIPFMKTRENRRDCEGEQLETYHLVCYDLKMFGHVTKTTEKKIAQLSL